MAIHAPITGASTHATPFAFQASLIAATLAKLDRRHLRAFAAVAIDLLDAADGDPDLEDEDPAGDPLDQDAEAPTDDATDLLRMLPRYAVDQSGGPTNVMAARKLLYRNLMAQA